MVVAARPRLHTAMLTRLDGSNALTWSGTTLSMARSIRRHVGELDFIGPIGTVLVPARRALDRMARLTIGRRILPSQSWAVACRFARQAERRLAGTDANLIFAPAGSSLVAGLRTRLPIVYSSDATASLMFDYYPRFRRLTARARREADQLERAAIKRADLILYPTEWAARSAIEEYGANPGKVHVVAYGANMIEVPSRVDALAPRTGTTRKILFVGVDWEIKGGALAVECLRLMRAAGIDVEMTVVGCVPPQPVAEPGLAVIPFLHKSDPSQRQLLRQLYLNADVFLLPTRCECFGIVFCEASSYGIPSIATATGGVPDVVRNGFNGYTLPYEAIAADYATLIGSILTDDDRLAGLRRTSRDEYEQRLNWDSWGRRTAELTDRLMARAA